MKYTTAISHYCLCFGMPVICDDEELPDNNWGQCEPLIILSEIKNIYLASTSGMPFNDWSDYNEWSGRLSETSNDLEAIRPFAVIGDKPLPSATIKVISKRRKKMIDKTHVINASIHNVHALNHEFLRWISGGKYLRVWYETVSNYLFGGNNGIIAFVTIEMLLARGPGEIAVNILNATWNDIGTEERIYSPIINAPICGTPIGVHLISSTYNSLTIGWEDGVGTFEYVLIEPDGPGPTDGTVIDGNSVVIGELSGETEYTFYIRTICEDGSLSEWVSIIATTDVAPSIAITPSTYDGLRQWDSITFNSVVTGGDLMGPTFIWQYSTDLSTWIDIVDGYFPLSIDSRLAGIVSGSSTDTLLFENVHADMSGWAIRRINGDFISNVINITVTDYVIGFNYYYERLYTGGGVISDPIMAALKRLIKDLNGVVNGEYTTSNIAALFQGIYPMINSDEFDHSLNLAGDPELIFNGSPIHDANGITLVNPGDNIDTLPYGGFTTYNDVHFSVYQRASIPNITSVAGNTTNGVRLLYIGGPDMQGTANSSGTAVAAPTGLDRGFFLVSRTPTTPSILSLIYNTGVSSTSTATIQTPTGRVRIGETDVFNSPNSMNVCFASIGTSLIHTSTGLHFRSAVNKFVTTLGRNV